MQGVFKGEEVAGAAAVCVPDSAVFAAVRVKGGVSQRVEGVFEKDWGGVGVVPLRNGVRKDGERA